MKNFSGMVHQIGFSALVERLAALAPPPNNSLGLDFEPIFPTKNQFICSSLHYLPFRCLFQFHPYFPILHLQWSSSLPPPLCFSR